MPDNDPGAVGTGLHGACPNCGQVIAFDRLLGEATRRAAVGDAFQYFRAAGFAAPVDATATADETRVREAPGSTKDKLLYGGQAAPVAELSASTAHEIIHPLTAISINAQVCQCWLLADPPNLGQALMSIERMIRDVRSAAQIVDRFRALSQTGSSGQAGR
ncbi:MAG TPA: histidine kinase dimerization/phospho-acceptor domain-containing protein [Stellaceae bacterium]|nr:histidine kinase dimerization/phospho-acceptor domain-containing protein [Stellaceae bacterium]